MEKIEWNIIMELNKYDEELTKMVIMAIEKNPSITKFIQEDVIPMPCAIDLPIWDKTKDTVFAPNNLPVIALIGKESGMLYFVPLKGIFSDEELDIIKIRSEY